jgi:hypothetical protein
MELEEQNIGLLHDIDTCMAQERVDNQMYHFLHVIEQLDESIYPETDITLMKRTITKALKDKLLMSLIELFYQVKDGEEGRMLFDPQVVDEPLYDLDSYTLTQGKETTDIYTFILEIRRMISVNLGRVKRLLAGDKGVDFEF